jgi:hypothetical protein
MEKSMTKNGRPAFDLLWELLSSDEPLNHFGREVVDVNRRAGTNYGAGLRDMVLDVRSTILPPTFPGGDPLCSGYRHYWEEMTKLPGYADGSYECKNEAAVWTMEQMTDREFGSVNWTTLADKVFPVLDENGDEK